jgi:hypothetical protein
VPPSRFEKERNMKTYKRQAVFADLTDYDPLAEEHHFIEVTQWHNGEGFDVEVQSEDLFSFQLTWLQFEALKAVIAKLEKL